MATTALFVEVLVIGALAEIWISILLFWFAETISLKEIVAAATTFGPLSTLLAVPLLALTYALGWVINFASERLFKLLFQKPLRDRLFQRKSIEYDNVRALLLHKGSSALIQDVLFDRHIIRIARGNTVNFSFLALALLLHMNSSNRKLILFCSAVSIIISSLSFAQWFTRYRSHYRKINKTEEILSSS